MARRVPDPEKAITVVSGLPRSGTSLLMQMLEAAGLEIYSDGRRPSDIDNPKGYFELEAVKRLSEDPSFLERSCGRVVKIVAPLIKLLPTGYSYRVIFIERDMEEVMASQRVMMEHCDRDVISDAIEQTLAQALQKQIVETKGWLDDAENIQVYYVAHEGLIESPENAIVGIANFIEATGAIGSGSWLQAERHDVRLRMADVVDTKLYRQRRRPE